MQWHEELSLQGEQKGPDAGKLFTKAGGLGGKIEKGAEAEDPMRMDAEDVVPGGVQLGRLHQRDGKVVTVPVPDAPASHALGAPAAAIGRLLVIAPPGQIGRRHDEQLRERQGDQEEESCQSNDEELGAIVDQRQSLQAPFSWERQRREIKA